VGGACGFVSRVGIVCAPIAGTGVVAVAALQAGQRLGDSCTRSGVAAGRDDRLGRTLM